MNTEYWLDHATRLIRFAPDRAAVRRELADHLQDQREAYIARGLSAEEAEERAAQAMGDPEEIAAELGRIHSPWWGWLWRLSQILLVCVLLLGIHDFVHSRVWREWDLPRQPELPPRQEVTFRGATAYLLDSWQPTGSARLGQYTVTVPLAYVRECVWDGETPCSTYHLTIYLRPTTWRFWEPCHVSRDILQRSTVTGSDGTLYRHHLHGSAFRAAETETWVEAPGTEGTYRHLYREYDGDANCAYLELEIPGPQPPDWLDIPLGSGGKCLRLDFEEETVS